MPIRSVSSLRFWFASVFARRRIASTANRKLCGDGEFDIKGFVSLLPQSSYSGPVGIEVLSRELRSWPLEKTATTAYRTTRAQFPD